MSNNNSINHLCIIEGEYKIYKKEMMPPPPPTSCSASSTSSVKQKLDELIEYYRVSLSNMGVDEKIKLVYSKDGSELYTSLLANFGVSASSTSSVDLDKTITTLNEYLSTKSVNQFQRTSHFNLNNQANDQTANYICFIICDFDSNDKVFTRLEEAQFKLTNFNNMNASNVTALSNTTTSCTSFNNLTLMMATGMSTSSCAGQQQKRFMIFGWPIVYHCIKNELSLTNATDVERPLYCKLMSGCFVCFTGFRKENKQTVAHCIKLVHYMGGSVRKEYNKKITHLIVKSTLSTKYKTAYNIGKCHLLTEEWIIDSWKHRNEVDFDVNGEEFLKKFKLKALYSLNIAFYGFTPEETGHMREVTMENGGTPCLSLEDPQCTHIVINDHEVKHLPKLSSSNLLNDDSQPVASSGPATTTAAITPTSTKTNNPIYVNLNMSPFCNTRASIVKAEWFWASIQICCRASECLYEFTKPKMDNFKSNPIDPPNKRMKLSVDNLLNTDALNSAPNNNLSHTDSPHFSNTNHHHHSNHHHNNGRQHSPTYQNGTSRKSSNNLLSGVTTSNEYDSPTVCNYSQNGGMNNINNISNTRLSTDRLLNGTARNNISNNNLSTSASLLDATTDDAMSIDSPFEKQRDSSHGLLSSASSNGASNNSKKINKRYQRIYELFETEKRFVTILHTIIHYFKEPIEAPDQAAGPILDQTEIREIFGNLPPIYEVHCNIKDRLEKLTNRILLNEESVSVGEIYMDNADALLKTYPPFVNFYEKTKDAIMNCDRMKPRFHAFLKIAQSKPECARQTLVELLIRPVQRLPSTLLLLDDILKETPKTHRDHELLSKAIGSLKEVMTHINEDKRKIENQLIMFDLINDIENCPANLLSSHRSFLKKLYANEMSNELLKKGSQLTLFLFSDCLEICKPRFKFSTAKSPNPVSKQRSPTKIYKHIALFSLNNVTKVCDILQNNDDTDLFGILCRLPGEKDKFFSFKVIPSHNLSSKGSMDQITSTANLNSLASQSANTTNTLTSYASTTLAFNSTNNSSCSTSIYSSTTNLNLFDDQQYCQAQLEKKEFIKLLAQGICNVKCITEYENILCTIEAKQLQMDLNESGSKKLDAVKSYAKIINRRVSRAFSFSQDTPNKIKKTISSVFRSPFQTSYSQQQSLNEQKASKLASLASLQLTPTLIETKRKFITLKSSRDALSHNQLFRQQTCSSISTNITTQTTSSLLSLDTCLSKSDDKLPHGTDKKLAKAMTIDNDSNSASDKRLMSFPDITNIFNSNSFKRQHT